MQVSLYFSVKGGISNIDKLQYLNMDYHVIIDVKKFLKKHQKTILCYETSIPFLRCVLFLLFFLTLAPFVYFNIRNFPFGMLFLPFPALCFYLFFTVEKGCNHRRRDHAEMLIYGVEKASQGRIWLYIDYRRNRPFKARDLMTKLNFVVREEANA